MKFSNLTEKDGEELKYFGYRIGEKVGQGTYSKVYKASFSPYESPVFLAQSTSRLQRSSSVRFSQDFLAVSRRPQPELACKVVEKSYKMPKNYPHRFMQRELNIMTKLKHPYIPKLHSILRKGDKFMVFMTFAARGNLCDFIKNHGPVREDIARRWIRQLTLALIYLHTLDIAHRDISCDNILLTQGWNVKLCDYGYACFSVTVHGWPKYAHTHCGSMPYVAPEIIRAGVPYNPKYSDIWSLGIVSFVMVNGTLPFRANSYEVQYNDQIEQNYSFRQCLEISSSTQKKIKVMLEPNPLLRISLQEIMDSNWMRDTNSKVPQRIREQEIAAQLEAESIKEYMKVNHDKKLSIQYPTIQIEKESFGKRLSNLMKRYQYKERCKGHHGDELHFHFRAKAFLATSQPSVTAHESQFERSQSSTTLAQATESRSALTVNPSSRDEPSPESPAPVESALSPQAESPLPEAKDLQPPSSSACSVS